MKDISVRMAENGLPYEITNVSPQFMLSGGKAVVACWTDGNTERSFVGFGHADPNGVAREAGKRKGVYATYVVNPVRRK